MVKRKRLAFSLTEALISMLVLSIAIFASVEVFLFALKLTIYSEIESSELLDNYKQVQWSFFSPDPSIVPNPSLVPSLKVVPVPGEITISFPDVSSLKLVRYDIGNEKVFRIYRPDN